MKTSAPVLPKYYTRLPPFQEALRERSAVLMYHKLGSPPFRTRLRGLYVRKPLFRSQLAELSKAGIQCPPFRGLPGCQAGAVSLTFDDGFRNVFRLGLPLLEAASFHAIQFLVAGLIGRSNEWEQRAGEVAEPLMDAAEVRDWLQAGQTIGAHSVSHPYLTRIPLAQAREEILASRKMLEDRFSVPVRHFCYPFGDFNPAIKDLVIEAGYESACTTTAGLITPNSDPYALNRIMARHQSRGIKAIKKLFSRRARP